MFQLPSDDIGHDVVLQQFVVWNAMAIIARSPRSSDLAPSDLHVVGHVKGRLTRDSFETGGDSLCRSGRRKGDDLGDGR
jgi:hypothetical protein